MSQANTDTQTRNPRGRFVKGHSGNPGGRPAIATEVRDLARQHGPHAIRRLVELSRSADGPVAVSACKALLDRGYGRPEQGITLSPGPNIPVGAIPPEEAAQVYAQLMAADPTTDLSGVHFLPTSAHPGAAEGR